MKSWQVALWEGLGHDPVPAKGYNWHKYDCHGMPCYFTDGTLRPKKRIHLTARKRMAKARVFSKTQLTARKHPRQYGTPCCPVISIAQTVWGPQCWGPRWVGRGVDVT